MANQQHLKILQQGVETWNQWRKGHPDIQADLRGVALKGARLSGAQLSRARLSEADLIEADLSGAILNVADLSEANLRGADLRGASLNRVNLSYAILSVANLAGAKLKEAYLGGADLKWVNLSEADLSRADLGWANLGWANLTDANLNGADLSGVDLSGADLSGADLTGCSIYAITAWNALLSETIQSNLIITRYDEPTITVENLKIAQFIYLWLNSREIREVIDITGKKIVLILGRFTSERKTILYALRDELLKQSYSPVLYDFEKPGDQDFSETMLTLAQMSRFVLADITDSLSKPQDLQTLISKFAVPVQPLLLESKKKDVMLEDFSKFPGVLSLHLYKDQLSLLTSLKENLIRRIEEKVTETYLE